MQKLTTVDNGVKEKWEKELEVNAPAEDWKVSLNRHFKTHNLNTGGILLGKWAWGILLHPANIVNATP